MHNLSPQFLGLYLAHELRFVAIDGELLLVGLTSNGCLHECIVNLHRDVGTSHLAFGHLRVDERLTVRMLDAHREHQCTASAVLCHFARTITITFHEGHEACRCQCRIVHGRPLRTDMAQVVAHAAAPLHQLHLLLVDAHNGTVAVGITVQTDDEAVAQ